MEAAQGYTKNELETKKYSELQKIAKALGIKGGRLKTDKLIEAILEVEVPDSLSEDAGNIATALAEAAVKEEEESMEAQDVKAMDSSDLLADIDFPDDDLLGDLQQTPAKTPGQHTKNGLPVPTPQSSLKKSGHSAYLGIENAETPDASSNGSKRKRTETFEIDDEISFPNASSQVDDEISFPKLEPTKNEKLPSLTPAQVSKRRRGRGRKPVLAVIDGHKEKSSQIIQEISSSKNTNIQQIRRESTFDKESSDLTDNELNNSELKNQSIVREGTFVKDEENKSLVRENTFTKDEPEINDSTEKLSSSNNVERPLEAVDDDIVTSDFVSEFVADSEEPTLPEDDIITSDSVTEFVAQPTESATPEMSALHSENISSKPQLSVKKSRPNIYTPISARKSLASGSTPGLNRKSITISRRSVATPLVAKNVRKSIGVMGIHISESKKAVAGISTPGGAKVVTPVTKMSLTRKSVGTPLAKLVTPVTKINSRRKSIGTPLAVKKSISSSSQLGQKATTKDKTDKMSNIGTSNASKLVKPTFSIGRTAPVKTEQTNKHAASGIPRFVSYARKIKMPDFTKIHERAFKKMEALDDYQGKKHRRTRTVTAGDGNGTPKANMPKAVTPVHVFTPSVTKVKNVNLNFAISAENKKSPNNSKSPKNLGKNTTATKRINNSASKNTSKSPKLVTKSPNGTIGKARKSPKVISTKSPKTLTKLPKVSVKSPKMTGSKPHNAKSEVTRSGIPTLKENLKPDGKSAVSQLESKIPAPKIKVSSPKDNLTSVEPSKPVNYRPYTGAIKPFHQRKTIEELKNLAMKNPKVKSSVQVRAGQRSILKGVRINKRFELQMANRGFDLQLDS